MNDEHGPMYLETLSMIDSPDQLLVMYRSKTNTRLCVKPPIDVNAVSDEIGKLVIKKWMSDNHPEFDHWDVYSKK